MSFAEFIPLVILVSVNTIQLNRSLDIRRCTIKAVNWNLLEAFNGNSHKLYMIKH